MTRLKHEFKVFWVFEPNQVCDTKIDTSNTQILMIYLTSVWGLNTFLMG